MTRTHHMTETTPPLTESAHRQSVIGELGRLAQEAANRVEEGFILEALSSLVALGRVNTMVIENLQDMLTEVDSKIEAQSEFRCGVYL